MAKIEISRQYANKDLVQDVKIVRSLNPIEVNQYNEKTTEWAKRLQESKGEFEDKVRKKEQNIRRRNEILGELEFFDPVASKLLNLGIMDFTWTGTNSLQIESIFVFQGDPWRIYLWNRYGHSDSNAQ